MNRLRNFHMHISRVIWFVVPSLFVGVYGCFVQEIIPLNRKS